MAPVMRYDPYTGKPLAKEGELPKPPITPKVERSQPEPTPVVAEPEPSINPFIAPDNREDISHLLEPLNKVLEVAEDMLKVRTSGFKVRNSIIPKGFQYKPTVTRMVVEEGSAFNLNKPKEPLKCVGASKVLDYYIDRVFLEPLDVKELLKNENAAINALVNLVSEMYENLVLNKNLIENKEYYGTTVATIAKLGQIGKYCSDYQEELIEIRLFSDIVEIKEGVENVVVGTNTSVSQSSEGSETIAFGIN